MFMYQNVYDHRDVRAFEIILGDILKEIAEILSLFNQDGEVNWEIYYQLDDDYILSLGSHWIHVSDSDPQAIRKGEVARKILSLTSSDGDAPLVQAYARKHPIKSYPPYESEILKKECSPKRVKRGVEGELKEMGKSEVIETLRYDNPTTYVLRGDPAQADDWVGVYDEDGNLSSEHLSEVLSGVPIQVVGAGIYCPPQYKEIVEKACLAWFEEGEDSQEKEKTST
jgi:hypothetical protein